ncbi:hypothetical protein CRUP_037614 [Coryphaenoides rupestris]|nr:hypothetical protein CRUP_037614 [Coryphaenoides rupestris]
MFQWSNRTARFTSYLWPAVRSRASYVVPRDRRLVSSLPLRMTDPVVKRVVSDVIRSPEDKRVYRGLDFTNGLRALLISDPTTDKSSAALDVQIGSLSDPANISGLAHFCEHMLFLGTEKYPKENEYSQFLSEHAGSSNAFTSGEHTNYYFDVSHEHLQGALDSCKDREVNAVDSEHEKNLMNDAWRLFQLEKATGNPDHPFSKFGTGNKLTLETRPSKEGVDIRQELLKFHSTYYSSNLMGLCVLGRESLDDLTSMVVKLFGEVENKNVPIPEFPEHPFQEQHLRQFYKVVPIKDIRNLYVTFPIPDLQKYYKSNPGHYLGHLIGHEGPGSLLSELKSKGWVNTLVGGQKEGARGFMFFIINVDLTEEGLLHVDDIIFHMFQYIQKLRTEGPQEWVFQECKDKERPCGYTSKVAGLLHYYPLEEVLAAEYLLEEFRPDLIQMVLDKLRPEHVRVAVVSKSFEGQTDKEEEWYGTQYKQEAIDDEVLKDTAMSKVWFKQDDKFFLPKACLNFEFFSPFAYVDPLHCNMAYLYLELLKDSLNEYAYAAELAGLNYDLQNTIYGMFLSVKGYNDKQHILLKKIMEKMTRSLNNFRAEQPHQHAMYYLRLLMTEVAWTKDELRDALDDVTLPRLKAFIPQLLSRLHIEALLHGNITKESALGMMQLLEDTLIEHAHTKPLLPSQLIRYREVQVPDDVTLPRLKAFIPQLLSRLHIEALLHGNITKESALGMMQLLEDTLIEHAHTKPLLPSQLIRYREVQVPDGGWYVYQQRNEVHNNCGIEIYYQTDMQTTRENMLLELFCQIISEPCFNTLRTKEQLEKAPHYLESRVEAFLRTMQESVGQMSDEAFQKHIQALAIRRLDKPKKLAAECAKYWGEIISQQYNFDRDNIEVSYLKTLTKENVMQFYQDLLAIDAPKRHKVSVHVLSREMETCPVVGEFPAQNDVTLAPAPSLPQPTVVQDMTEFKRNLPLFPLAKPHVNFMAAKL